MKRNKKLIFTALGIMSLLLVFITAMTPRSVSARCLYAAIDVSSSAPIATNDSYRANIASYVRGKVAALSVGDYFHMQTFGVYDIANQKRLSIKFNRRERPYKYAPAIEGAIKSLIFNGSQENTNIIGTLNSITSDLKFQKCALEATEILVFSDGVEASEYVRSTKDFVEGKIPLPTPEAQSLKGLSVEIIGIGVFAHGGRDSYTQNIRKAWTVWMSEAGANFSARGAL